MIATDNVIGSTNAINTRRTRVKYQRMWKCFWTSRGAREIVLSSTLLCLGLGVVFGRIPLVLSDRYARLYHGYDGSIPCYAIPLIRRPVTCQAGAEQAQNAAANWNLITKLLSFFLNPVCGSWSDSQGRRLLLVMVYGLFCIPSILLFLTIRSPRMDPTWYYASTILWGVIDFTSISFAALSDCIPMEYRTASYGLLLSTVYGGFNLAPSLSIGLDSTLVAAISSGLIICCFLFTVVCLPETLRVPVISAYHIDDMDSRPTNVTTTTTITTTTTTTTATESGARRVNFYCYCEAIYLALTKPFRDIAILCRSRYLILITIGSLLSSIVFATDVTLVVYYLENTLAIPMATMTILFLVGGVTGILIQALFLPGLVGVCGESTLLVTTFVCGMIHNFLFGAARPQTSPVWLYLAFILSQFTKVNGTLLSAMASRGVTQQQQGRVQGALFAMNALAAALGPWILEHEVYQRTQHFRWGPGCIFLVASGLYGIGAIVLVFLPKVGEEGYTIDTAMTSTATTNTTTTSIFDDDNRIIETITTSNYDPVDQSTDMCTPLLLEVDDDTP